jgi:hypothetical protein
MIKEIYVRNDTDPVAMSLYCLVACPENDTNESILKFMQQHVNPHNRNNLIVRDKK